MGTVGRLEVAGGAINVIAGQVRYTIDIRAPEDGRRRAVESQLFGRIHEIAARRSVRIAVEKIYDVAATPCAPWLMAQLEAAIAACGVEPVRLPSGAGHDGMAISAIADIGMIFVRSRRRMRGLGRGCCGHLLKTLGSKRFFFEKKNQKTFVTWAGLSG